MSSPITFRRSPILQTGLAYSKRVALIADLSDNLWEKHAETMAMASGATSIAQPGYDEPTLGLPQNVLG